MTHPNTDQGVTAEVTDDRYLLVKRGLYYRPGNRGYTGIKEYAGRYPVSDASPADCVTAIHEDEAPEYSQACYHDLMAEHVVRKAAALEAEIASLKQRLESAGRLVEKGQNIVAVELRQLLESCCLMKDGEPIRETLEDGPSEIVVAMEGFLDSARAFLQEQEKQNG